MGFADAYLQKHAIRGPLISESPDPQLNTIIAIPAYNESGLTTCLDSLFNCDPPLAPAEVIVLINSAESSSREIVAANRRSYGEALEWVVRHRVERLQDKIKFHVVLVEGLPDKHFGAGLARKLVMDEAVRRLAGRSQEEQMETGIAVGGVMGPSAEKQSGRATNVEGSGIIVSLDADTVVRRDYLLAVEDHFSRHPGASGCSISFEHPLSRQEYINLFYESVIQHPSPQKNPIPEYLPQDTLQSKNLQPENRIPENRIPEYLPPEYLQPENLQPENLQPENRIPKNLLTEFFPPEVFKAVTNYELHQRYYLLAVRYTGYPYAFHTVGSCFAVQVEAYCRAGGMSRRKAGEDFYFIQKVAMQGGFTECRSTRVYPSPRPSDRVPFGTGPDIARQIDGGGSDASVKHPDDRGSDGTGPDIISQIDGGGSDSSVKHPDDRGSDGAGPDIISQIDGGGSDSSVKHPDDRGSDGTGADRKLSAGSSRPGSAVKQLPPYLTYNPELFEHLREFFALIPRFYDAGGTKVVTNVEPGEAPKNDPAAATDSDPPTGTENDPAAVLEGVPPLLRRYLEEGGFLEELGEIRGNTASEGAFRKRFFNKLSMFRILKYLHYAEEHGVERMEVTAAAGVMLEMWGEGRPDYGTDTPENGRGTSIREEDRPEYGTDTPENGRGTSILEEGSPDYGTDTPENGRGTSTREMLLLYRKHFG